MSRGNRGAHLRAAIAAAILSLALTLGAAPASAAVPREGNTFKPRNGEELLEAADAISAEFTDEQAGNSVRIALAPIEYAVDRPVVLDPSDSVNVYLEPGDDQVDAPAPVITHGGTPGPLLVLDTGTQQSTVRGFELRGRGTSLAAFPLVEVRHGILRLVDIEVPASMPNVVGVALRPGGGTSQPTGWAAQFWESTVVSDASAPAVELSTHTAASSVDVYGGDPAVDFVGGPGTLDASLHNGWLEAGESTRALVRLRPGAGAGAQVDSSVLRGDGPLLEAMIDVGGTANALTPHRWLHHLTIDAPRHVPALRVAEGVVHTPGTVYLGSSDVVECSGTPSSPADIRLHEFYATGSVGSPGQHCSVAAQGQVHGVLALVDRSNGDYRPTFDSALVGAGREGGWPELFRSGHDVYGGQRNVFRMDLGAAEYQGNPPEIVEIEQEQLDSNGLLRLSAEALDIDPVETERLTYEWRVGSSPWNASPVIGYGPTVEYRFPQLTGSRRVRLVVTDPAGWADAETVLALPNFDVAGGDTPTPAPPPSSLLPFTPNPPSSKPKPTTVSAKLLRSRIAASSHRRKLRLGAAAKGEGALEITSNRPVRLFVSAWKVRGKGAKAKRTPVVGARSSVAIGVADLAAPVKLALPARLGKVRLKPGLYELRIKRGSATGPAVGTVRVRVTR